MKKNLKGFTLTEIIVAIAIFAIMALIVVSAVSGLGKSTLDTEAINRKTNSDVGKYNALVELTGVPSSDEQSTTTLTIDGVTMHVTVCETGKTDQDTAEAIDPESRNEAQQKLVRDGESPNLKYIVIGN